MNGIKYEYVCSEAVAIKRVEKYKKNGINSYYLTMSAERFEVRSWK